MFPIDNLSIDPLLYIRASENTISLNMYIVSMKISGKIA